MNNAADWADGEEGRAADLLGARPEDEPCVVCGEHPDDCACDAPGLCPICKDPRHGGKCEGFGDA